MLSLISKSLVLYLKNCAIYCLHCSIYKEIHHCQNTLLELHKSKLNSILPDSQKIVMDPFFFQVLNIMQKNQVDLAINSRNTGQRIHVPTLNIQQA